MDCPGRQTVKSHLCVEERPETNSESPRLKCSKYAMCSTTMYLVFYIIIKEIKKKTLNILHPQGWNFTN